jgi:ADP-ribose pyrophosphatase
VSDPSSTDGADRLVTNIEIVDDLTARTKCDEGFLKVRRYMLRNTFSDGSVSEPYACDVLSRRSVDAVAVVLWHKDAEGKPWVHYREGTRPAVWLRRLKQDQLTYPDAQGYDLVGEIVAGVLEEGDDGPEGVRSRGAVEAHEEAGYEVPVERVLPLGDEGFFPSPGVTDEKVYLCSAEVDPAERGHAHGDGSVHEEGTRMVSLPLKEAVRACREGKVPDAKTELGILRLADQLGYLPQLDLFASELPEDLRARYDGLGLG